MMEFVIICIVPERSRLIEWRAQGLVVSRGQVTGERRQTWFLRYVHQSKKPHNQFVNESGDRAISPLTKTRNAPLLLLLSRLQTGRLTSQDPRRIIERLSYLLIVTLTQRRHKQTWYVANVAVYVWRVALWVICEELCVTLPPLQTADRYAGKRSTELTKAEVTAVLMWAFVGMLRSDSREGGANVIAITISDRHRLACSRIWLSAVLAHILFRLLKARRTCRMLFLCEYCAAIYISVEVTLMSCDRRARGAAARANKNPDERHQEAFGASAPAFLRRFSRAFGVGE